MHRDAISVRWHLSLRAYNSGIRSVNGPVLPTISCASWSQLTLHSTISAVGKASIAVFASLVCYTDNTPNKVKSRLYEWHVCSPSILWLFTEATVVECRNYITTLCHYEFDNMLRLGTLGLAAYEDEHPFTGIRQLQKLVCSTRVSM